MGINFQQALGQSPLAAELRLERTEILSANMANVDTPNFKAKDMDFAQEMQRANDNSVPPCAPHLEFRVPFQPSEDGNTVELNIEQAAFSQNTMSFQTSLSFLNMSFRGLETAIEGK